MKLRKGDHIKIVSGKDRGKTGTVLKVYPEIGRITVEGVNLYKKRVKAKRQGQTGETVMLPRPFSVSRAGLVCGSCKQVTRAGYGFEGATKVRICKKCKARL